MADQPLQLEVRALGKGHLVSVRGEVDLESAPLLQEGMRDVLRQGRPIVVDLSEVTYLDSSGFHVLQQAADQAPVSIVVRPDALLARTVRLAGLDSVLTIHDNLESATAALEGDETR